MSKSSLLCLGSSGRDGFDDADRIEPRALSDECGNGSGRSLEEEEADLVLRDVDRPFETNGHVFLGQLRRGRARPSLAGTSFTCSSAGEVRLDEIARHALDAMTTASGWKRQNVSTLLGAKRQLSAADARAPSVNAHRAWRRYE